MVHLRILQRHAIFHEFELKIMDRNTLRPLHFCNHSVPSSEEIIPILKAIIKVLGNCVLITNSVCWHFMLYSSCSFVKPRSWSWSRSGPGSRTISKLKMDQSSRYNQTGNHLDSFRTSQSIHFTWTLVLDSVYIFQIIITIFLFGLIIIWFFWPSLADRLKAQKPAEMRLAAL